MSERKLKGRTLKRLDETREIPHFVLTNHYADGSTLAMDSRKIIKPEIWVGTDLTIPGRPVGIVPYGLGQQAADGVSAKNGLGPYKAGIASQYKRFCGKDAQWNADFSKRSIAELVADPEYMGKLTDDEKEAAFKTLAKLLGKA